MSDFGALSTTSRTNDELREAYVAIENLKREVEEFVKEKKDLEKLVKRLKRQIRLMQFQL